MCHIILIYISQTNIYINTLKKEKNKQSYKYIQQSDKTYTILHPTLKQFIVSLQSSAGYIRMYNIQKRDLLIQYTLLYNRSKERAK